MRHSIKKLLTAAAIALCTLCTLFPIPAHAQASSAPKVVFLSHAERFSGYSEHLYFNNNPRNAFKTATEALGGEFIDLSGALTPGNTYADADISAALATANVVVIITADGGLTRMDETRYPNIIAPLMANRGGRDLSFIIFSDI